MAEDNPVNGAEPDKHPGGRPLKYKAIAELDMAIQLYFDRCDPHVEPQMVATGVNTNGKTMFDTREVLTEQKPYTMHGLARALGVDRKTLLNYKKRDEFFPPIQGALDRCAEYAEGQLFGPYANGAKFALTNNYSAEDAEWSDKKSFDHTTKGQPMPLLGGTTPLLDEAEADDEGEPEVKLDPSLHSTSD